MIELNHIKKVYFLGIGGIGMSALARYFVSKNYEVYGYDRNRSELCVLLESIGCSISYKHEVKELPNSFKNPRQTLVVYTPAIPKTNQLLRHFTENGYNLCKRSEVLGAITMSNECLAIAGTHGKTTISSMLAYVLSENKIDCSAFLGGISTDFDSNLRIGADVIAVVEADEFDRSFLHLDPNWALVSSMDADHLDIYGTSEHLEESFRLFADKVERGGLIAKEGLNLTSTYTYALNSETADFAAKNIRVEDGAYHFDIVYPDGVCEDVITGLPGIHNVENALGVFAMAYFQKISTAEIVHSIASFSGVRRRFEFHIKTETKVYIDDYAHHPKEIEVAIRSARDLYPNKKLTVVFQPHLYSRTRDFMCDFASVLSKADKVMLLDIYPARELPIEGISSKVLLTKIKSKEKGLYVKSEIPNMVASEELLMTLGAGDIDQLILPIKKYMLQQ